MIFTEKHQDLFSVDFEKYIVAHCISSDCKMGAGIAVSIKKKFHLEGLVNIDPIYMVHPVCYYHNGVYNLITKKKYWHKPTYESLGAVLSGMYIHADSNKVKFIVMPKIGCGLDGLSWPVVREMIKNTFKGTDIEILVCKL